MKIAFTGGGTAGHAMVNSILIPFLQQRRCQILYIGSHTGMEKAMVEALPDVQYFGIRTGKLRRYLSLENVKDIFRVIAGCFDAYKILKAERPQLLYSGGGYVSVPVVVAAGVLRIPVLIRETDMSMGLANRLCLPFAQKFFTAFPTILCPRKGLPCAYPGALIRPNLLDAPPPPPDSGGKPSCLVIGGSLGARRINNTIWDSLGLLTQHYRIVHICGRGNLDASIPDNPHYTQLEFATEHMGALLAAADVVVTRCGSNAILETLALGKPTVCIPLGTKASRGEQAQNAAFAVASGNAVVLRDTDLNGSALLCALQAAHSLCGETPYKITKAQLLNNIHTHVDEIYDAGLKNVSFGAL